MFRDAVAQEHLWIRANRHAEDMLRGTGVDAAIGGAAVVLGGHGDDGGAGGAAGSEGKGVVQFMPKSMEV